MNGITKLNRRQFLQAGIGSGAALALAVSAPPAKAALFAPPGEPKPAFAPNAFVSIGRDGQVTITVSRSEMGQGVRTSMAMLVAEELEVTWQQVRIEQATGHPKFGNQNTDGSRSVRTLFQPLRQAGAAAREMLERAAAKSWSCPPEECRGAGGEVHHKDGKRRLAYAKLAEAAAALELPENPKLKKHADFKIIGKDIKGVDVPDIVHGKARYGLDVTVPGMVYASVEHVPVVGATIESFSADEAKKVAGVLDVIKLDSAQPPVVFKPLGGLAVVAENSWAAFKGREKLEVKWNAGPNGAFDTEAFAKSMSETAKKPGHVVRTEGDVDAAFAAADQIVEGEYYVPLLAHASMEPPVATAWVKADSCEVWAPVQAPQRTRTMVAQMLGLEEDRVTVHVTLLGGGFGRKSKPDFVLEAVAVSKAVGKPVKVTWTREDDIRHDYYHSDSVQYLKAALGKDGKPTAWLHRTVFPSIGSTFSPEAKHGSEGELGLGFSNNPYAVPNVKLEVGEAAAHVRIGWLRAVCNIFHAFAINRFVDKCAATAKIDPLAYRLDLLGEPRDLVFSKEEESSPYKLNTGRLKKVLQVAADKAGWGKSTPKGQGRGIACHYSFHSYIAQVVHVEMKNGDPIVRRVDVAVDCGTVVNPDNVRAQMEGAVVFGLTLALNGMISAREGRVLQGNFDTYPMLRMPEMPEVQVHLIESDALPTGIGEPGVPPLAPALAAAIEAASGVAVDRLPVRPARV